MECKNRFELVQDTLRESSKDDKGNYLLDEGDEQVYLLDEIGELVAKQLRKDKKTKSVDAVVINDDIYFIEFKNTRHSHMPKNELYYKAHDSIFTFLYALAPEISLEQFREKVTYVVVYNDNAPCKQSQADSQSFNLFKHKLENLSDMEDDLEHVLWELKQLEGVLYKKVYTVDKEVFTKKLKPLIWKEDKTA